MSVGKRVDILSKSTGENGELEYVWDSINGWVFEAERPYREMLLYYLGREN